MALKSMILEMFQEKPSYRYQTHNEMTLTVLQTALSKGLTCDPLSIRWAIDAADAAERMCSQ
jgi:hypothetical protein